jgi:hypothetical protein
MKRKKKCQLLKHGKYIQFELGISHKFVMNMYTCIGYLWQFLLATVCCMENEHGNFTKMKMFDNSSLRLDDDMHWHGGLLSLFLVSRNQIRFRVYSTRLILVGSDRLTSRQYPAPLHQLHDLFPLFELFNGYWEAPRRRTVCGVRV